MTILLQKCSQGIFIHHLHKILWVKSSNSYAIQKYAYMTSISVNNNCQILNSFWNKRGQTSYRGQLFFKMKEIWYIFVTPFSTSFIKRFYSWNTKLFTCARRNYICYSVFHKKFFRGPPHHEGGAAQSGHRPLLAKNDNFFKSGHFWSITLLTFHRIS